MKSLRRKVHEIIFEADTFAGKAFDVILLVAILLSVIAVMLESVKEIQIEIGPELNVVEWVFTILFSLEYLARIYVVDKPLNYIFSFYGLIDLFSILPTYLGLFFVGNSSSLLIIRSLRLTRIFRIFKLRRYLGQGDVILQALKDSRPKIIVFLLAVLTVVIVMGSVMYFIEGGKDSGFTSIPRSIYWAVVTLTTVGYGDISPVTVLGQFMASIIMILGYAIIAVPTGIVTSELINGNEQEKEITTQACTSCTRHGHDRDAVYCKHCGAELNPPL